MRVTGSETDAVSSGGGIMAARSREKGGEAGGAGFEASLLEMLDASEEAVAQDPHAESGDGEAPPEEPAFQEVPEEPASQDMPEEVPATRPEQEDSRDHAEASVTEVPPPVDVPLVQRLDGVAGTEGAGSTTSSREAAPVHDARPVPREVELPSPAPRDPPRAARPDEPPLEPRPTAEPEVRRGAEADARERVERDVRAEQRVEAQREEGRVENRRGEAARASVEPARSAEVERTPVASSHANEPRGTAHATGLSQANGSEVLREAATDSRGGDRDGDSPARPPEVVSRDASAEAGAKTNPEAFTESLGRDAGLQTQTQSEAMAASTRSDGSVSPATPPLASAPTPIEPVVDVPEPAAPASTARPLPPEAIPQHIEWLAARGGGSASIQLYPPELGKLAIQVTVRGDDVRVVMNVREVSAQAVVGEYRDNLENALASKDLKLDGFEVRDWRDRDDGGNRQEQDAEPFAEDRGGRADPGRSEGRRIAGIAGALAPPVHANANPSDHYARNVNLRV